MEKKINYRVQLKLVSKTNDPIDRYQVLKMISNWINNVVQNEKFKKVIFNGIQSGELDLSFADTSIKVKSFSYPSSSNYTPKHFTLRFSHGEAASSQMAGWRTWINDIAIEELEDKSITFSMANSYQIRSGYIGRIDEPQVTSPNIIKQLVSNDYWKAYNGKTILSLHPIEITQDNVKQLVTSIFDTDRNVPLVYISRDDFGNLLVEPSELSKRLVGNAIVYYESDYTISQYLRTLPYFPEYRCSHGAIRIYLPKANFKKPNDSFRHRYYTAAQIRIETPQEIVKIISESLVRRSVFTSLINIQSIDDIERLKIEQSLIEAIAAKKDDKIIEVYHQQVENLKVLLAEKESELSQYCNLYDDKDLESDLLRSEIKTLEAQNFSLKAQVQQMSAMGDGIELTYPMPEFIPTTLGELLECIEKGYPKKIVVLEEARRSANEFEVKDLNKAYKLLRSIPDTLHNLMFNGDGDKRASYADSTGFDLSMTESKMTKRDSNLAKLRIRNYKGNEIDINAHVGFGNRAPNMLRVHFHVHPTEKLIIIGHCGDHLDNFSTKSMN